MSPAPKNKSVLVACSLEQYARHTQTFNLYALWTMRFGQTHGVPCPQVRSGGRLAGPRCRSCLPYAKDLGRSRSGRHRLASNICASARAAAPRAAHGLDTHAKSAIGQWMCGPRRRSDEGCVKSLTPHWASSPKSELRHFVGFGRGFLLQTHRRSIFSAHQTAPSESNHEGPGTRWGAGSSHKNMNISTNTPAQAQSRPGENRHRCPT